MITVYDCIVFEADTILPSFYYYFYLCHQAQDNYYQALGYLHIKYLSSP